MDDLLDSSPPSADQRLAYGRDPSQFGDLRLPVGNGPHPLVIAFHGGFWRARYDLSHLGHLCAALTRAGFATFSVEYRRVGQTGGGFPGTCDDAAAGAKFALKLDRIDPQRVVLLGHSAGGHLALWAAKGLAVRGVVALAAVSDLARAAQLRLSDGIVDEFVGATTPIDARTSPIERLPLGLPQILIHGDADDIVPFELSERYAERARALGDPATLIRLSGEGHYAPIDPASNAFATVRSAMQALVRG